MAPDDVIALRVFGSEREYPLPQRSSFTLGASRRCDVALPGSGCSAVHCTFVRKGSHLQVIDHQSTNGLYFGERRVEKIDLYPGEVFTVPPLSFIAMNEVMRAQYPVIADIVGKFTPTADQILVEAVRHTNPLLITGGAGSDIGRLAQAIHAVSLRRSRELVRITQGPDPIDQLEVLQRAARSTLIVDLQSGPKPFDPEFYTLATLPESRIRLIVLARAASIAHKTLAVGSQEPPQHIWIRPLAMRPGDVPRLLDRALAEQGASFRLSSLTPANRAALCDHQWRENLEGLRTAAERLVALSRVKDWESMNWQDRSEAARLPTTTIFNWFRRVRLTFPLFTTAEPMDQPMLGSGDGGAHAED